LCSQIQYKIERDKCCKSYKSRRIKEGIITCLRTLGKMGFEGWVLGR
jgi:hypothetical protein